VLFRPNARGGTARTDELFGGFVLVLEGLEGLEGWEGCYCELWDRECTYVFGGGFKNKKNKRAEGNLKKKTLKDFFFRMWNEGGKDCRQ
jgi:hypothetical protein